MKKTQKISKNAPITTKSSTRKWPLPRFLPIPLLVLIAFIALASAAFHLAGRPTPVYGYKIVNAYPHDSRAFTQGLVFDNGTLYESTGLNGSSSLRRVDLQTGRVLKQHNLSEEYFAEGLALWQDRLIQLTWRSGKGFVYDKETFRLLREFSYPMEGWGLTHDNKNLILSDGTSMIYYLDPADFRILRRITVTDKGNPITNLNELEYINGEIYANIWRTNRIARISPKNGKVLAWINLSGLQSGMETNQPIDVLNGIAFDARTDRLFVTGKLWPKLYEISLGFPKK